MTQRAYNVKKAKLSVVSKKKSAGLVTQMGKRIFMRNKLLKRTVQCCKKGK